MTTDVADNPVSPEEPAPILTRHKPHRWPGIAFTLLVILLLIVGAAALMLTRKPVWHTYTTHGGSGATPHFLRDYPDGWQPVETMPGNPAQPSPPKDVQTVGFTSKPLTGFAAWWSKVVLREDPIAWQQERIDFMIVPDVMAPSITQQNDTEELKQTIKMLYLQQPGEKATCRNVQHPLGPALEVTLKSTGPTMGGGQTATE